MLQLATTQTMTNTHIKPERTAGLTDLGIPVEIDEFWTSRQRQGHSLHEISYRACFKSQLPEYFIQRYTKPGDSVLDPFMGRGTTPLQAHLMGRVGHGSDANPLCLMLARPRFNPPNLADIQARLDDMPGTADIPTEDEPLLTFYHPTVLQQLIAYKLWFADRTSDGIFDNTDDWIRMVCINRLSGHSSGFFSVRTMPPNQAVTIERQRIINERNNQTPELKDIPAIIIRKSRSLLRSGRPPADANPPNLAVSQSHELHYLPDDSIDLVVTSPPFLDIVDYKGDNWLRSWFADIDTDAVQIDSHANPTSWRNWLQDTFAELARVLRPGGRIAFEVGEVRNATLNLEEEVIHATNNLPLNPEKVMINLQHFTKTSNLWGVNNNTRGTNTNRIVLLSKPV